MGHRPLKSREDKIRIVLTVQSGEISIQRRRAARHLCAVDFEVA